jgi:hypothetical protein
MAEMFVLLKSPQGMYIQGDGVWVGNNGEYGVRFAQHKDNPMHCGFLDGFRPCVDGSLSNPDADMFQRLLRVDAVVVEPHNIALSMAIPEVKR